MESKVPDIKRLIDVIPHQQKTHPKDDALCDKATGEWRKYSISECKKIVDNFSLGLLKMEFKKFKNYFIMIPCQIVKTGRKLIFRLMSWHKHLDIFFRAIKQNSQPLLC